MINAGALKQVNASFLEESLLEIIEFLPTLGQQGLVDVWDHTTTSDGGLDEWVEFLISSDGELEMSWSNSLNLQVLWSISSKLQDLSGEVLQDSWWVDSSGSSDSLGGADSLLQHSMDSSDWELLKF